MEALLANLVSVHPAIPLVLSALGTLVILGATYVALTPTKADDAWWAKLEATPVIGQLLKGLTAFSPFQRKEK